MDLVEAATADTIKDIEGWAEALFNGGTPDTSAFRDRLWAVIFAAMASGATTTAADRVVGYAERSKLERYAEAPWWKAEHSPNTSKVFKRVVEIIEGRRPTLAVLDPKTLSERLRQQAWFIAGVTASNILDSIREDLVRARIEGTTLRDFIQTVTQKTELSAARIETVFRTNVASAAGAARLESSRSDFGIDIFFGYQYVSKQDHRARWTHRVMDGFCCRMDDPVVDIIVTPNGFNCRCRLRPLRRHQAVHVGLIDKDGNQLQDRVYVNAEQRRVVEMAETGRPIQEGKRLIYFPDEGFRGNALVGLVA